MRRILFVCTLALWTGTFSFAQRTQQGSTLPGTQALTWEGDLSERMMDGAHRFVERKIDLSIQHRPQYWNRDLASVSVYEKSVEPNRQRFMKIIGASDPRVPVQMERFG